MSASTHAGGVCYRYGAVAGDSRQLKESGPCTLPDDHDGDLHRHPDGWWWHWLNGPGWEAAHWPSGQPATRREIHLNPPPASTGPEPEVSTQDAPPRLPLTPQSDAEGSGVAQDVRGALGAQMGVQRATEAAYEAGVAEGRRQAAEAIRARVGDIAVAEWAALIVEEEGRG